VSPEGATGARRSAGLTVFPTVRELEESFARQWGWRDRRGGVSGLWQPAWPAARGPSARKRPAARGRRGGRKPRRGRTGGQEPPATDRRRPPRVDRNRSRCGTVAGAAAAGKGRRAVSPGRTHATEPARQRRCRPRRHRRRTARAAARARRRRRRPRASVAERRRIAAGRLRAAAAVRGGRTP
jgi:hypothetical protein